MTLLLASSSTLSSVRFHCSGFLSVCSLLYFFHCCPLLLLLFYILTTKLSSHWNSTLSQSLLLKINNYSTTLTTKAIVAMCYLVVERYSVCRCLYYKHSIDMCAAYGTSGHRVQERTVLVGYACEIHSSHRSQPSSSRDGYSDSGYASYSSHRHSSRRDRR